MSGVNYCQRCRVYVDESETVCPLCRGSLVHREQDLPFYSQLPPFAQDREHFWQEAPHLPLWAIFKRLNTLAVFALVSTVFALFALALLQRERTGVWLIPYSYAILSLTYSTLVVAFLGHIRRFLLFLIFLFVTTALFLLALDLMDNHMGWSYRCGVPILLACMVPLVIPNIVWTLSRAKGLNIVAAVLFSVSFSFGFIDLAASSRYTFGFSGWSIVVAGVFTALGLYCLYLHYYAKVNWHMDRIFHVRRSDRDGQGRKNL